ncbi:MAG: Iron-sulfur cluster-binding protein [uncultured Sulfurovum sp.]|uniref:Iron-sulfur cluster-binding protein n=1 Tax=uncultured Sulfurovum sp. TaxID=269237 RepID=A0A6S6T9Y1_9BACT|nr:MAG: Iron-sulfur cluster-binding protein [uncultured Sulfurovum sp.]
MNLLFDVASCVRATSKFSECTKCVDICPVNTIEIVDNIPAFTPSDCTTCGGCVGSCPTEAFSLSGFSSIEFFFKFLEEESNELVCQKDLYCCLTVLSVEHLMSMAIASEEPVIMDVDACACGGDSDNLQEQLKANIEEANFILSSFCDKEILTKSSQSEFIKKEEEVTASSRRSLFTLKGAIKSKQAFDDAMDADELKEFGIDLSDISKIKNKVIPDKRKLLFSVLKRVEKQASYEIIPTEEISFSSQKFVDDSCTNCQICYRICPTGALSSNMKFSLINFDSMLCVKCHLCHDVCEPNAIQLQPGFEIKEFFEPTQRTLATFDIQRCNECGNYFTYTGGEKECFRCKLEEEEARELHALARKRNK